KTRSRRELRGQSNRPDEVIGRREPGWQRNGLTVLVRWLQQNTERPPGVANNTPAPLTGIGGPEVQRRPLRVRKPSTRQAVLFDDGLRRGENRRLLVNLSEHQLRQIGAQEIVRQQAA